jgi:nicotinamide mononucleotide (NMN) deamidase PncC
VLHQRHVFDGDRTAVREAAVIAALDIIARLAAE